MKKSLVLLLAGLLVIILPACGSGETSISGEAREAVLAYSEAKTDNLLAGMNANDYVIFSTDFDEGMLSAMTLSEFEKMKKDRDAKLGLYVSRQVKDVVQSDDYVVVIYDAVFEKDDAVDIRVVFHEEYPNEVSGLWFSK